MRIPWNFKLGAIGKRRSCACQSSDGATRPLFLDIFHRVCFFALVPYGSGTHSVRGELRARGGNMRSNPLRSSALVSGSETSFSRSQWFAGGLAAVGRWLPVISSTASTATAIGQCWRERTWLRVEISRLSSDDEIMPSRPGRPLPPASRRRRVEGSPSKGNTRRLL